MSWTLWHPKKEEPTAEQLRAEFRALIDGVTAGYQSRCDALQQQIDMLRAELAVKR